MNMIDEVKSFCKQKNNVGALLITGKWGSGKTFFIENLLSEDKEMKTDFEIIRISLFGQTDIKAVHSKVKSECILRKYPSLKQIVSSQIFRKINRGIRQLLQAIPIYKAIDNVVSDNWMNVVDIENLPGEYKGDQSSKKQYVLVFDDLERCKLNIVDTLGCLNEYVENSHVKTIIVADEDMLKDEATSTRLSYDLIKEKLIYKTITHIPKHTDIVDSIVRAYVECAKDYKKFLESSKDLICYVFQLSQTDNIRSLKCAIQSFERIYIEISKIIYDESLVSHIFGFVLVTVFESKANKLTKDENGYNAIDNKLNEKYSNYSIIYIINSVRDWIITGEWDQIRFEAEIQQIILETKKDSPKDIILKSSILHLTDEILDLGFTDALEESYAGIITFDQYLSLIETISFARKYGIDLPAVIDYDRMLRGVQTRIGSISVGALSEPDNHKALLVSNLSLFLSEEISILREISKYRERQLYIKNKRTYIEALLTGDSGKVSSELNKQMILFDGELAKLTYDYYISLDNNFRIGFGLDFLRVWKGCPLFNQFIAIESIQGLKALKKLLIGNTDLKKITKVIDGKFVTDLSNIIALLEQKVETLAKDTEGKDELNNVLI